MRKLLHDRSGSSAAEFGIVLPLLLMFLFGIIDAGRFMWTYNHAEKATQMGARMAVVTSPLSSSLNTSYLGLCTPALAQGDPIPASCYSPVTCTDSGCDSGTADQAAFRVIVDRMRLFLPTLQYSNVSIEYSPSGLGFAGDPNGPDISPIVTVKIGGGTATPLPFRPITTMLITTFNMPTFTTSLTGEDFAGSQSN